ncbi:hypothetical protein G3T14_10090 [Methylobacterium sp. BTF04]|uniref:hypothetical protein n=1 Tax=Methylobacterium sp. BTF04 TaxID=2708300 RepID=UPI0013D0F586|nr:hypothetical protein [Methylobacterium sp. BTF04]NEU12484.1 hypothetical protein [Methylobacterium sp. BTF04]
MPVADYLGFGPKTLEIIDSSIERSFAVAVSAQGSSKDRPDDLKDCPDEVPDPVHELEQLELFPGLPVLSEHSIDVGYDDGKAFQFKDRKDCERTFETVATKGEAAKIGGLTLDVDPPIESGLPRVATPARPFPKRPQRVADRPRSEEWTDDELLTLPEAAALFWPDGPITTNTLRTAGRDGGLAITVVARKFFTTPLAIRRMGVDEVGEARTAKGSESSDASPQALLQNRLDEAKAMGRERTRPRRAAKRSVSP